MGNKGTEQQIQPAANCCMNQPSNIVLPDTAAVSICISDCQRHRGGKKNPKKHGQETMWLLLFTSAIRLHQISYLYDISPSSPGRDKPFCGGCHIRNVNYLPGRGLNNGNEEKQAQWRWTSPRQWSLCCCCWWEEELDQGFLKLFTAEIRGKKITF